MFETRMDKLSSSFVDGNMPTRTLSARFQLIRIVLFVVLFVLFIYTFLHEAGHAIIGLLFGQSLTEFSVKFWDLSAHVGMTGGDLTQSQLAIQAIAGVSLPFLIWSIFMSLVPRKASFTLEVIRLFSSMDVVNTLLPWIILPFLFLSGKAPSDDVTNFLHFSQIPPLFVALIALIAYVISWLFFLSRIDSVRKEFLLFRTTDFETLTAGARTIFLVMSCVLVFCVGLTLTLKMIAAGNILDRFSPPAHFVPAAQVDLSLRAYSSEVLAEFAVTEPAYMGVFIAVHNINTTYFDLCVIGPNGYRSTVLHGEGYRADQDGGLWEEYLSPGQYQLILNSHQSAGTASLYLKDQ